MSTQCSSLLPIASASTSESSTCSFAWQDSPCATPCGSGGTRSNASPGPIVRPGGRAPRAGCSVVAYPAANGDVQCHARPSADRQTAPRRVEGQRVVRQARNDNYWVMVRPLVSAITRRAWSALRHSAPQGVAPYPADDRGQPQLKGGWAAHLLSPLADSVPVLPDLPDPGHVDDPHALEPRQDERERQAGYDRPHARQRARRDEAQSLESKGTEQRTILAAGTVLYS